MQSFGADFRFADHDAVFGKLGGVRKFVAELFVSENDGGAEVFVAELLRNIHGFVKFVFGDWDDGVINEIVGGGF